MISIIRENKYRFHNCKTNKDCDDVRSRLLSDDFDFAVFFDKSRAHALLRSLPPQKVRIAYGHEGGGLPMTEGILTVHSWPNPLLFEEEMAKRDPWLYMSRLGFCYRSYDRWKNHDDPQVLHRKLTRLAQVGKNRVLFAGSMERGVKSDRHPRLDGAPKDTYARAFEVDAVAGVLELVEGTVDVDKRPLLDHLLEYRCGAYLGADGNSIACYRDIESAIAAVPYLRVTAHMDYAFLVDPFGAAYVSDPSPGEILARMARIEEDLATGVMVRRIQRGRDLASILSKDYRFWATMEALSRDHAFLLSCFPLGRKALQDITKKAASDARSFYGGAA